MMKRSLVLLICLLEGLTLGIIGYFTEQTYPNYIVIVACLALIIRLASYSKRIFERKSRRLVMNALTFLLGLGVLVLGILSIMKYPVMNYYTNPLLVLGLIIALAVTQMILLLRDRKISQRFEAKFMALLISFYLLIDVSFSILSLAGQYSEPIVISHAILGGLIICLSLSSAIKNITDCDTLFMAIGAVYHLIKRKRMTILTISMIKDLIMTGAKFVIGVVGFSVFMIANGLYSMSMGFARFNIRRMQNKAYSEQLRMYIFISKIIMVMSVAYIIYTARFFVIKSQDSYSMNLALIIALYTFVEFYFDIKEILRLRKRNDLLDEALRYISFSSTLISFVLTQTAIMSFTDSRNAVFANAMSGLFFGSLVFLIGLFMLFKGKRREKKLLDNF